MKKNKFANIGALSCWVGGVTADGVVQFCDSMEGFHNAIPSQCCCFVLLCLFCCVVFVLFSSVVERLRKVPGGPRGERGGVLGFPRGLPVFVGTQLVVDLPSWTFRPWCP